MTTDYEELERIAAKDGTDPIVFLVRMLDKKGYMPKGEVQRYFARKTIERAYRRRTPLREAVEHISTYDEVPEKELERMVIKEDLLDPRSVLHDEVSDQLLDKDTELYRKFKDMLLLEADMKLLDREQKLQELAAERARLERWGKVLKEKDEQLKKKETELEKAC